MPGERTAFDLRHMRRALDLARDHDPHPNPRVGSVIVASDGSVVGEGAHQRPGAPHAEALALGAAGSGAQGSTVYVTLEPCSHQGRTPPCADALISAGVGRVVIAAMDPDSRVGGRGAQSLREAGIEVVTDVMGEEARAIDPGYFHHRSTGKALVTLKYAMTLDGAVAARDGSSQWITSPEAREDAHRLRASSDAVLIGAGTMRHDDPRLDVRLAGYERRQPRAVVVAGNLPLPEVARLWGRSPLVVSTSPLRLAGGENLVVEGHRGRPDPRAVCSALADRGYLDLLVEGGPTLAGEWWRSGVISRAVAYIGARIGGGVGMPPLGGAFSSMSEAVAVIMIETRSLGDDLRIDYRIGG